MKLRRRRAVLRLCIFLLFLAALRLWSGAARAEQAPAADCAPSYGDASRPAQICIARATTKAERPRRDADICAAIAHYARRDGLPPGFFARLIWRESLFEPNAVSHAGAQGVAQFMPGTAKLRGLKDPFNPAEALGASSAYLAEMRARYGNLGLAAAAYNAGEGRINGVVAGRRGTPGETRAYVLAITGLAIEDWTNGEARPDVDYALTPQGAAKRPFMEGCLALAATRRVAPMAGPQPSADWRPWGALIAAHRSQAVAARMFRSAQQRHGRVLGEKEPLILRRRLPGRGPRALSAAMVGADSRKEAMELCRRLSAAGGACVVVKN